MFQESNGTRFRIQRAKCRDQTALYTRHIRLEFCDVFLELPEAWGQTLALRQSRAASFMTRSRIVDQLSMNSTVLTRSVYRVVCLDRVRSQTVSIIRALLNHHARCSPNTYGTTVRGTCCT